MIEFTQYKLPNGSKEKIYIGMDDETEQKAAELVEAGCYFCAEILTNGLVSLTCENDDYDDVVLNISLSANGPEIIGKVKGLVEASYRVAKANVLLGR